MCPPYSPGGDRLTVENAISSHVASASRTDLATSTAVAAGVGQSAQLYADPSRALHVPKGPYVPAGSAATAALSTAGRSDGGVSGVQGKRPSAHVVATKRPKLSCFAVRTDVRMSRSKSRRRGRV